MKILIAQAQNRDLVDRIQQIARANPEQEIEVTLASISRGVAQRS